MILEAEFAIEIGIHSSCDKFFRLAEYDPVEWVVAVMLDDWISEEDWKTLKTQFIYTLYIQQPFKQVFLCDDFSGFSLYDQFIDEALSLISFITDIFTKQI